MAYAGPDRRAHRVLVTTDAEYFMRRRLCLRVRDRSTGLWLDGHRASGTLILGSVDVDAAEPRLNLADVPRLGECVMFGSKSGPTLTTPVVAVARPPRELMATAGAF